VTAAADFGIIDTPVVAEACKHFSHIYRHPRGLFLSYPLAERMEQLLENRPNREVDVIVVSDGERILGIGDQGAGGMGIPIGKLSLYTLMGGVEPSRTLPILLDAGTNNQDHLRDPEYIGWRNERIAGDAYWGFVDRFITAVKRCLPDVLLQWEDFAKPHLPFLKNGRTASDSIASDSACNSGTLATKRTLSLVFPKSFLTFKGLPGSVEHPRSSTKERNQCLEMLSKRS
jgi:malate dehydrogenase (oxaloacetate-decarboxylating)